MSANTMTHSDLTVTGGVAGPSQRTLARLAGALYLVIFLAGFFAEFYVRSTLIVSGDAAATAANIGAAEGLFRAGIAADLVMILADVTLALLFYVLFRPISRGLALLAAFFRLAQATALGVNLLNLFLGLHFVSGGAQLAAFSAEQQQALALPFFAAHDIGYSLALVFFALSLVVLGYLIYRSDAFPRILGVLLMLAALGYQLDNFGKVLLTNYAAYQPVLDAVVLIPAFIAEIALCLWLLIRGVNRPITAPHTTR